MVRSDSTLENATPLATTFIFEINGLTHRILSEMLTDVNRCWEKTTGRGMICDLERRSQKFQLIKNITQQTSPF